MSGDGDAPRADGQANAHGNANPDANPQGRRLKGFGTHLVIYFAAMIVLVPVNYAVTPADPWFVLPMVGWGSVLAVHAAHVLGLFRGPSGGD